MRCRRVVAADHDDEHRARVPYPLCPPLLALDLIREHVAGDLPVSQSMLCSTQEVDAVEPDYPFSATEHFERPAYLRTAFIENKCCGDETGWWVSNRARAEAMLRSAGLQVIGHPEGDLFVCRVAERSRWAVPVYPMRGVREGQGMMEAAMLWKEPSNKSRWGVLIDPERTPFAEMMRRYAPAGAVPGAEALSPVGTG